MTDLSRCVAAVLLLAMLGGFREIGAAQGTTVPDKLTPNTFEAIKARVTLTRDDLAWQNVPWRVGFFEGLVEAQAADKPIFFWFYGGGASGLSSNC